MNGLAPYAAFFMRLAVGGVFLVHGITKFRSGVPAVAAFLHSVHIPFASIFAVVLIALEPSERYACCSGSLHGSGRHAWRWKW